MCLPFQELLSLAGAEVTSYMPEAKVIIWPQQESVTSKLKELVRLRSTQPSEESLGTAKYHPRLDDSLLKKIIATTKLTPVEDCNEEDLALEDTLPVQSEGRQQQINGFVCTSHPIGRRSNSAMSDDYPPQLSLCRRTPLNTIAEHQAMAVVHEKWLLDSLQQFVVQPYSNYALEGLTDVDEEENSLSSDMATTATSRKVSTATKKLNPREIQSTVRRKSSRVSTIRKSSF